MLRIINERSTGKTKKLLQAAKENNGIVVCKNPIAMREKAEAYGIFGLSFYSYGDFWNYRASSEDAYIDELEECIKYSEYEFTGYTLTNGD